MTSYQNLESRRRNFKASDSNSKRRLNSAKKIEDSRIQESHLQLDKKKKIEEMDIFRTGEISGFVQTVNFEVNRNHSPNQYITESDPHLGIDCFKDNAVFLSINSNIREGDTQGEARPFVQLDGNYLSTHQSPIKREDEEYELTLSPSPQQYMQSDSKDNLFTSEGEMKLRVSPETLGVEKRSPKPSPSRFDPSISYRFEELESPVHNM